MKNIIALFLLLFALIYPNIGSSQDVQKLDERNPQAMIKASFLFQFAKQSNWVEANSSKPFIIAVYGNNDIFNHLTKKYAMQPMGSQTLKIVKIESLKELKEADIVFIDNTKMADFKTIKRHYQEQSTLLVTEVKGALEQGSIINFVRIDSELRIEIDNLEAKRKKIGIGKLLLKWSINNN